MSKEINKKLLKACNTALVTALQIALENNVQKFDMKATLESGAETNITCLVTQTGDISIYTTTNVSGGIKEVVE